MRYLLKLMFNVAVTSDDDDGNATSATSASTPAPAGYDNWFLDLQAVADAGMLKLTDTWKQSKREYRDHLNKTNRSGWERLKQKATAKSEEMKRQSVEQESAHVSELLPQPRRSIGALRPGQWLGGGRSIRW